MVFPFLFVFVLRPVVFLAKTSSTLAGGKCHGAMEISFAKSKSCGCLRTAFLQNVYIDVVWVLPVLEDFFYRVFLDVV